jgi:hypothetical protein
MQATPCPTNLMLGRGEGGIFIINSSSIFVFSPV